MPDFRQTFIEFFRRLNWGMDDIASALECSPEKIGNYILHGENGHEMELRVLGHFGIGLPVIKWVSSGDPGNLPISVREATDALTRKWTDQYEEVMSKYRIK